MNKTFFCVIFLLIVTNNFQLIEVDNIKEWGS